MRRQQCIAVIVDEMEKRDAVSTNQVQPGVLTVLLSAAQVSTEIGSSTLQLDGSNVVCRWHGKVSVSRKRNRAMHHKMHSFVESTAAVLIQI